MWTVAYYLPKTGKFKVQIRAWLKKRIGSERINYSEFSPLQVVFDRKKKKHCASRYSCVSFESDAYLKRYTRQCILSRKTDEMTQVSHHCCNVAYGVNLWGNKLRENNLCTLLFLVWVYKSNIFFRNKWTTHWAHTHCFKQFLSRFLCLLGFTSLKEVIKSKLLSPLEC